jgi:hypothetical protein
MVIVMVGLVGWAVTTISSMVADRAFKLNMVTLFVLIECVTTQIGAH